MGPERGLLTAFEKACDDTLTAYLDGAKSVPFGVEVVVGYLYAKESELTASARCCQAVWLGWTEN